MSLTALALMLLAGCPPPEGHGPVAEDVSGPLGTAVPFANEEQLQIFARGEEVALRRFDIDDGLGPAFNVTFCGSCHEKPVTGGGGGLYRNFWLSGVRTEDGAFFPGFSAGDAGGVIRLYNYGDEYPQRPPIPEETNVIAQRNPIPFFGVGLIAALEEHVILENADPEDEDGDGVSGRPNYDRGFVGRFGRKAQTVSIEGFIRGPLFNHLGVTSDPLSEAQRAALPVDSSGGLASVRWLKRHLGDWAQAAAPDGPLTDEDDAEDPELAPEDLFDLVSFAMLLAAPEIEDLDEQGKRGRDLFDGVGCGDCHVPRLEGPRGPLPIYSDLLLHDMGPGLADGLQAREALGNEFRTQPLWGVVAAAPYLHDGRAATLDEAIRWHGGEASRHREAYLTLSEEERADLMEFLHSLGGRDQATAGLLPPDDPIPAVGEYGGPVRQLDATETERFESGRRLFDYEFGRSEGVGGPRLNGDSCRACHFDPVLGGSGPRGVNVTRHGIDNADGDFVPPVVGTILHRTTVIDGANRPQPEANIFEMRQTPHLFGLGLIEGIDESVIVAAADPDDTDEDGISGRVSWTDGGRVGRFGWKAQVPTIREFVRDAVTAELGMTLPWEEGQSFGKIQDNDDVADPEFSLDQARLLEDFMVMLGPPPRQTASDAEAVDNGKALFESVGCIGCHTPSLPGADGDVPLFSDLLLHEILPAGASGIEDAGANVREFRTAPLWGLAETAPYLHDGRADTIEQAIKGHDGEAAGIRDAFTGLTEADRADLLTFLETL